MEETIFYTIDSPTTTVQDEYSIYNDSLLTPRPNWNVEKDEQPLPLHNEDVSITIICIVGESGSGKTTLALELATQYNIPTICSYTTRPMRTNENHGIEHYFVKEEDMPIQSDMLAYTKYGGYHYWAKHSQLRMGLNSYVIDQQGLDELKEKFSDRYKIISMLVIREDRDDIDINRKIRDKYNPINPDSFDIIINNNYSSLSEFYNAAVDALISYFGNSGK